MSHAGRWFRSVNARGIIDPFARSLGRRPVLKHVTLPNIYSRTVLKLETCEGWETTNALFLGSLLGVGLELPLTDLLAAPASPPALSHNSTAESAPSASAPPPALDLFALNWKSSIPHDEQPTAHPDAATAAGATAAKRHDPWSDPFGIFVGFGEGNDPPPARHAPMTPDLPPSPPGEARPAGGSREGPAAAPMPAASASAAPAPQPGTTTPTPTAASVMMIAPTATLPAGQAASAVPATESGAGFGGGAGESGSGAESACDCEPVSETVTLTTATGETVTVTATVTPCADEFLWEYEVHNVDFTQAPADPPAYPYLFFLYFDTFNIPPADISDSGSDMVNTDGDWIRWFGPEIPTGESAIFSFTTAPCGIGYINAEVYESSYAYGTSGAVLGPVSPSLSLQLKSVIYSGDGFFPVVADPGTDEFTAGPPHWLDLNLDGDTSDSGERAAPVAYARNSLMSVSANFVADLSQTLQLYAWVRAIGPDGINVPPTRINLASGEVTLPTTAVEYPFGNAVNYYGNFNFDWQFSSDSVNWTQMHGSSNELYVTLATSVTTAYHTLIHLSTVNSIGATTEPEVIAGTWGAIAGRNVKRQADGKPLHYYKSWKATAVTTAGLLNDQDGQCAAWARFFLDALANHNIQRQNNLITFRPKVIGELLTVQNWTFNGNGTNPDPGSQNQYPYYNTMPNTVFDPAYEDTTDPNNVYWRYRWAAVEEVNDQGGIPGQNTSNPLATFGNHIVALIDGTYYDAILYAAKTGS
jgi:hypothetical protein